MIYVGLLTGEFKRNIFGDIIDLVRPVELPCACGYRRQRATFVANHRVRAFCNDKEIVFSSIVCAHQHELHAVGLFDSDTGGLLKGTPSNWGQLTTPHRIRISSQIIIGAGDITVPHIPDEYLQEDAAAVECDAPTVVGSGIDQQYQSGRVKNYLRLSNDHLGQIISKYQRSP